MVSTRSFRSTNCYTNPDLKCFRALTLSAQPYGTHLALPIPDCADIPVRNRQADEYSSRRFGPCGFYRRSAMRSKAAFDQCQALYGWWAPKNMISTTNDLVRRVVATCPGVKAVILAAHLSPHDMLAALQSGACGFLSQDIPGEWLIKSLELIAHADMVVLPHLLTASNEWKAYSASQADSVGPQLARLSSCASVAAEPENQAGFTRDLTRREILILRSLMEGASNKVIALKLVMTDSTVKVHMKANSRKLQLQNRTQARTGPAIIRGNCLPLPKNATVSFWFDSRDGPACSRKCGVTTLWCGGLGLRIGR